MPLQRAVQAVSFTGGVSTKQDEKGVPATQLLKLENATFIKETTLAKRNGYRALSKLVDGLGTEYGTVQGFATYGNEAVLFDDYNAYSYRPSTSVWSKVGGVSSVINTEVAIANTSTQQWCTDTATVGGVTAIAWEDSRGGIYISTAEDASGRVLLAPRSLDSDGTMPRVVVLDTVLAVIYAAVATGRLMIAIINPVNASDDEPTTSILVDDLSLTMPRYDAEPMPAGYIDNVNIKGGGGIIAWVTAIGYRIGYIAPSGVLGSPVTGFPSVATYAESVTGPIAVDGDAQTGATNIAAVWQADNGFGQRLVKCRFHSITSPSTATRGAVTVGEEYGSDINRIACAFGGVDLAGTQPVLSWAAEVSGARMDLCRVAIGRAAQNNSSHDGDSTTIYGHTLMSRAFHDGVRLRPSSPTTDTATDGHAYVTVGFAGRFFPYAAVMRISSELTDSAFTPVCVARMLAGSTPGHHMRFNDTGVGAVIGHLPSVEARNVATGDIFSRQHRIPLPVRQQLDSANGDQFSEVGIRLSTVDFAHEASYQTATFGRGLYLGSANPLHYDGDRFVEAEFHCAPDIGLSNVGAVVAPNTTLFSSHTTGTGGITSGTYLYRLWYEDQDAQDETHRGPTSVDALVTVPADGSNSVTITIPTYRMTSKSRVKLCVARSKVGQTTGSADCYRVTSVDPADTSSPNDFIVNNVNSDTVTFIDELSDGELVKREPLYTNGGIVPNDPTNWCGNVIAGGKSRLYWTDAFDPNLVRFSKSLTDETGMEPTIDFSVQVDPYGGRVTGVAIEDETVLAFCETAIYQFGGAGPDATGGELTDSAFTPAELVTSDVGCSSPGAIGTSPDGIAFATSKGIRLLDRTRKLVPIGDPVYAYKDQAFTAATLLPDRSQVVFLTSSGLSLLWDYERQQWSTYTNHEGIGAGVIGGIYYYCRNDGRVFVETPGVYRDDGSHIRMTIRTAWIKMLGYLQGWQRILRAEFIGRYASAHALRVGFAIDYEVSMQFFADVDVDSDVSGDEYGEAGYGDAEYGGAWPNYGTVYQQGFHVNQRCQAIQFEICDVEATDNYGAAFELSEMLLTGGAVRSSFKLPASRSQ